MFYINYFFEKQCGSCCLDLMYWYVALFTFQVNIRISYVLKMSLVMIYIE